MAEQRIPGRHGTISVVSDTYGFGSISGPAEPAEDPSKWKRQQIGCDELLRRYGSTDEYDAAKALGLPRHVAGMNRNTVRWKVEQLQQWDDCILTQAARTPKR